MKTFLLLVAPIVIVIGCCADNDENPRRESKPGEPVRKEWLARRDSILSESKHSSVYLTRDTLFERYNWLLPTHILTDFEEKIEGHRSLTTNLADTLATKVRSFRLGDLTRVWAEIYLLGNEYCVYSPSDWMANAPKHVTDSAMYTILSDQGYPDLITGFHRRSSTHYELNLSGLYGKSLLTISVVDIENGIALWEYRDTKGKVRERKLYVDARNVKRFPMVVCDCLGMKCPYGYDFKEPDFDSLLKTRP